MILLVDIGNTRTHLGWAGRTRVLRTWQVPTSQVLEGGLPRVLKWWLGRTVPEGACLCSVVPAATEPALRAVAGVSCGPGVILGPRELPGLEVACPRPSTIGADRLAGAVAARHWHGAPVLVVGCGTATTFDLVDRMGRFVGGAIAPGLAMLAAGLHEHTAQLPLVTPGIPRRVVGRNTRAAIRSGIGFGYLGMVRGIIQEMRRETGHPKLPVVATGGNARRLVSALPEIGNHHPHLVLEGLRLVWEFRMGQG